MTLTIIITIIGIILSFILGISGWFVRRAFVTMAVRQDKLDSELARSNEENIGMLGQIFDRITEIKDNLSDFKIKVAETCVSNIEKDRCQDQMNTKIKELMKVG